MGRDCKTRRIVRRSIKNPGKLILMLLPAALVMWFWFGLPEPLFQNPYCTILEDRNGELLSARIADDGQWRFPEITHIPEKFEKAVLLFEDRHFYKHPGVNPLSLVRALKQNIEAGRIVSGGSTITMQLIRLSRKGKPRNLYQKAVEILLALRAEIRYAKKEILALYASHAPFGGNVVGLNAAAWRYYKRNPQQLSWAETAALAILPNAPALIYPGKNKEAFQQKRNGLLRKLWKNDVIDRLTYDLAIEEPLPGMPQHLPRLAPHLINHATKEGHREKRIVTTVDRYLQKTTNQIIDQHHQRLQFNEIHNAAALILDVETGNVLAYTGNTRDKALRHQNRVNVITAPRSSGSILKPLLYAAMLSEGEILRHTLVPDIPTEIGGYSPKNFDEKYEGAVPASEALFRSLNVPAVRMLQDYGLEKFYHKLKELNLSTIKKPAAHYGLSVILGGSEVTLWEITGIYASMARTLNHYRNFSSRYHPGDYHPPNYLQNNPFDAPGNGYHRSSIFSAASIWMTFDVLTQLNRPRQEAGWEILGSSKKIAWKTGTSFGFRDGWAIGITPRYAVGVWAGNADGEGRPGLTGLNAAAPILFDIFAKLPDTQWFEPPYDELTAIPVCITSGYQAGRHCPHTDTILQPQKGLHTDHCPFHVTVNLDKTKQYRVTGQCTDVYDMQQQSWFVLPPAMAWYYQKRYPQYKKLPPFAKGCGHKEKPMEMIHPRAGASLFIPVEIDGSPGKAVFRAAHKYARSIVYWHLDKKYLGKTTQRHEMTLRPTSGKHTLHLVDHNGNELSVPFTVVEK
jgi:penicillin-binding protein 1C